MNQVNRSLVHSFVLAAIIGLALAFVPVPRSVNM